MEITVLGTGSPIPLLERKGTGLVFHVDDEPLLVDCGPGTVHRLIQYEIPPQDIETLFFTHHHLDHNADFFNFAIAGWSLGRESLKLYGPPETETLLESLFSVYEDDLEYRSRFDYPEPGIYATEWEQTTDGSTVSAEGWRATAMAVDHSIETYAYRFEEIDTGTTVVFSGDTRMNPELGEFASGADVLIQDCCVAPTSETPPEREGLVWDRLTQPMSDEQRESLGRTHCNPEEAGDIASAAEVDTLVLTHLLPYRDTERMRERASAVFDGAVYVAEDGMRIETSDTGTRVSHYET